MMLKQRVGFADTLFFCVYQGSRKKDRNGQTYGINKRNSICLFAVRAFLHSH